MGLGGNKTKEGSGGEAQAGAEAELNPPVPAHTSPKMIPSVPEAGLTLLALALSEMRVNEERQCLSPNSPNPGPPLQHNNDLLLIMKDHKNLSPLKREISTIPIGKIIQARAHPGQCGDPKDRESKAAVSSVPSWGTLSLPGGTLSLIPLPQQQEGLGTALLIN